MTDPRPSLEIRLIPSIQPALRALAAAAEFAADVQASPWEFALDVQALGQVGVDSSVLRWLIAKGLVECARETTADSAIRRSFQPHRNLSFPEGTCFVLTPKGAELARSLIGGEAANTPEKPRWDRQLRTLWLGNQAVKSFRVPAANQEAILSAFEELGWPPRIDDPLPNRGKDGDVRLRDTIKALNGARDPALIRFLADGTGQGVLWKLELDGSPTPDLPWILRGKMGGVPQ